MQRVDDLFRVFGVAPRQLGREVAASDWRVGMDIFRGATGGGVAQLEVLWAAACGVSRDGGDLSGLGGLVGKWPVDLDLS